MTNPLRVAIAGLGYFSQFHIAAWRAHPNVRIVGACDPDPSKAKGHDFPCSASLGELIETHDPDIVDIIAPPPAHAALIGDAIAEGRWIVCQKPFATSLAEAQALAARALDANATLIIHENFRFQPWYRALKDFLSTGTMGRIYQARFALRPGDGRGPEAYLARQPAFQFMPRLLIHETGVHFIDLFRWLFGDVTSVYADLEQLNPAIAGEDSGLLLLGHESGVRSIFDGNRLGDHVAENPRKTMGELQIEGEGGTLTMGGDGALLFRPFGARDLTRIANPYPVDETSFGGGCVAALINHVIDARLSGKVPENLAHDYLHVAKACNAAYQSAETGQKIQI